MDTTSQLYKLDKGDVRQKLSYTVIAEMFARNENPSRFPRFFQEQRFSKDLGDGFEHFDALKEK